MFNRPFDLVTPAKRIIDWNRMTGSSSVEQQLVVYEALIKEEYDELKAGLAAQDHVEVLDALCDLFVVTSYYVYLNAGEDILHKMCTNLKLDTSADLLKQLDEAVAGGQYIAALLNVNSLLALFNGAAELALAEVCDSNWSKFPEASLLDEDKANEIAAQINGAGRYTGVTWAIQADAQGVRRYVFRNDAGKVVKPLGFFQEPQLARFCAEA